MKTNVFFILFLFFISHSLVAQEESQDFEITWSQPTEHKAPLHFVGAKKIDNGYIVFSKETIKGPGGFIYYIEYYNDNMVLQNRVDISEHLDEKNYIIQDVLTYDDNFILVTSRIFKNEGKEEIYLQKINDGGDKAIGNRIKIHEETIYRKKRRSRFKLNTSPNDNFLLIQVTPERRRRVEPTISLIVLDNNLEVSWSKTDITYDFNNNPEKDKFNVHNIIVDDFGSAYFIGQENKLRGEDYVPYKIFKMQDGKFFDNVITLNADNLQGIDIQFSLNNTLHALGFYTEGVKSNHPIGVSSFVIDNDLTDVLSENFYEFNDDFHLFGLKGRALDRAKSRLDNDKKASNRLRSLETEDILIQDDGSLILIGEVQYVTTHTSGTGENQTVRYVYHYDELIVSHINPNGEILNASYIRKKDSYSSPQDKHNVFYTHNENFIKINLKRRNQFLDFDEDKGGRDNLLSVYILNDEGEHTNEVLFDYTDKPEHRGDRIEHLANSSAVLENKDIIILSKHSKREYKYILIKPLMD